MPIIILKALIYKDSELFLRRSDRKCDRGCCEAAEWTIYELAFLDDFGGLRFWNRELAECSEPQCILNLRHTSWETRLI